MGIAVKVKILNFGEEVVHIVEIEAHAAEAI